jgi:dTDP-4-dehydrorhamnose reductase
MKNLILATGMSGLVGTRVNDLLSSEYEFHDLSLSTGVDITDYQSLEKYISNSDAKIILHMAARTDVDGCEDEKILGDDAPCWKVNVTATENIAYLAKKKGMKIIYISTDFVFDGVKNSYSENDEPNPVNWYGYTKYKGEEKIRENTDNFVILRIAYPYRSNFSEKKDFVRRMIEKMEKKEKIMGLTDHIITPTFIDDIAEALRIFFQHDIRGIYHAVGSQSLSVYESVEKIAKTFGLTPDLHPVKRMEYFKNKAFRPFKLSLKNDKITESGLYMKSFDEGLTEIKKQMEKVV